MWRVCLMRYLMKLLITALLLVTSLAVDACVGVPRRPEFESWHARISSLAAWRSGIGLTFLAAPQGRRLLDARDPHIP